MDHGSGHDLLMMAAAGLLAGGGLLFLALSFVARRDERAAPPPAAESSAGAVGRILTLIAVSLAIGAGLIHLAGAPAHIEELGLVGWGFVGATVFQASWALAYAISPSRGVAITGMAGSLGIVLAWAWSRAIGLPVGPQAGVPEPVGVPDAVATLLEVLLVGILSIRLTGAERRVAAVLARTPSVAAIAAVPAVGMVVVATSLAVTLSLGHDHGADGTGHGADGTHGAGAATDDAAEPGNQAPGH